MPDSSRTSEDQRTSPSPGDVTARAAIAVGWRFVAFAAAGALFLLLTSLTEWQRTFAPSQAWLEVIDERASTPGGDEWLRVLSRAVGEMLKQPPVAFESAGSLFEAVRASCERISLDGLSDNVSAEIEEARESQRQLTALRERRSALLRSFDACLDSEGKDLHDSPSRAQCGDEPVTLAIRRQALADHIAQRNTAETSLAKTKAAIEGQRKEAETHLRTAFDAVAGSARPVPANLHHFLEPRTALEIGDGQHPLHILYVVTWYGLECSIALLIALVLVPWLLRLAGGSGDAKEVRSTITSRIRGWLEDALGQAAKVIVTGAAATAIAGATIAATPQESRPTVQVFVAPATMASGERGEQGLRGEPGLLGGVGGKGDRGEKGERGDVVPPGGGGHGEPPPGPSECLDCLEAIEGQSARLDRLVTEVGSVSKALASFVASASQELKALSARSAESLTSERQIATSTSQCATAQEGIRQDLAKVEGRLTRFEGGLSQITEELREGTHRLEARADEVLQLQASTSKAVAGLYPVIGDVLRVAAGPEGALQRWILRHDYRVTPEALAMIRRGLTDATNAEGPRLVDALGRIDNLRRNASDFRKALEDQLGPKPPESLKKLLEQSMPLIYWACREPKPGAPS